MYKWYRLWKTDIGIEKKKPKIDLYLSGHLICERYVMEENEERIDLLVNGDYIASYPCKNEIVLHHIIYKN